MDRDTNAGCTSRLTRRSVLHAGSIAFALGLAGCSSGEASEPDPAANQTSSGSATYDGSSAPSVEGIDFDVQNLVVRLVPGHSVSDLSLIAPDGTLYTSASVATGQTTVAIRILDVDLMSGDYTHYEPGVHELVLETGAGQESVSIPLEPDLEIVDVEPVENPENPIEYGQLVVTVANGGTGPTWVYDVAFEGAPNFAANDPISDNPGVFVLKSVDAPDDIIVAPNQSQQYSSVNVPLVFSADAGSCSSIETEFQTKIATATGHILEQSVVATGGGSQRSATFDESFVCSDVSVETRANR
jgi:hypothetical protein